MLSEEAVSNLDVPAPDVPPADEPAVSFSSLDVDAIRAVGTALARGGPFRREHQAALNSECRDRRSPCVVALSATCSYLHASLLPLMRTAHDEHLGRQLALGFLCERLGTSWRAIQRAGELFLSSGEAACALCGQVYPRSGRLFAGCLQDAADVGGAHADEEASDAFRRGSRSERDRWSANLPSAHADEEATHANSEAAHADVEAAHADGAVACAYCWRAECELSMRPLGTGVEQTWEAPIEEGSWQLVRDFGGEEVDSPLLAREEFSEDFAEYGGALVDSLNRAGCA